MSKRNPRKHNNATRRRDNKQDGIFSVTVPIKGMHCASCELLIAEELESVSGVKSAVVSLKNKSATVISNRKLFDGEIRDAVKEAGYEVGQDVGKSPLITSNKRVWKDFIIGLVGVGFLIALFKMLGLDDMSTSAAANGGAGTIALVVGLTAGFSTCMALIGGLVLSVASKYAENHPTETAAQKFRPHIFFNLGRIVSFIVLGAAIGGLGSAFALKGATLGYLTMAVGVVMLVLGLQLTELFPRITKGLTLPSGFAKKLGLNNRKQREYSHKNAFFMGALTFLLPCGFTQAMQLLAVSTGDPLQASVIMGAFAIGTAPGLLSIGGVISVVKGAFAQRFFRVAGVMVIAMSMLNFANGFTLADLNRYIDRPAPKVKTEPVNTNETKKDLVTLNTVYKLREDIQPSRFTTKVGQKTTLSVYVHDNGRGCMSTIMIIGLDDNPQFLKKGKTLELTFTAKKPGVYQIACAMGVPRGTITVEE